MCEHRTTRLNNMWQPNMTHFESGHRASGICYRNVSILSLDSFKVALRNFLDRIPDKQQLVLFVEAKGTSSLCTAQPVSSVTVPQYLPPCHHLQGTLHSTSLNPNSNMMRYILFITNITTINYEEYFVRSTVSSDGLLK